MDDKLKSALEDYFKRFETSKEVYENGGKLFHDRGSADSYGKTETAKYTRSQLTKVETLDSEEKEVLNDKNKK